MSRVLLIAAFTLVCLSKINGMRRHTTSAVFFPSVDKYQGFGEHYTIDLNKSYLKNMATEVILESFWNKSYQKCF